MTKYEEALECPNCILGLNCKTCKKKMVLQEAVEKAQAFDSIEYEKLLKDTTFSKLVDKETAKIRIAFEKAQALDRALDLLKQKRENAQNDLESIKLDGFLNFEEYDLKLNTKIKLKTQIATYTDCIATIEAEMGRTER